MTRFMVLFIFHFGVCFFLGGPKLLPQANALIAVPTLSRISYRQRSTIRHATPRSSSTTAGTDTSKIMIVLPDYLITDSLELLERPSLMDFIVKKPLNILACLLVFTGFAVSISNLLGNYYDSYLALQSISIGLGFIIAAIDCQSSFPPYSLTDTRNGVSPNIRLGVVDDALLHLYSGIYTASASWLALRTSVFCPSWLSTFDVLIGPIALAIFSFSLACPVMTLIHHYTASPSDQDNTDKKGLPFQRAAVQFMVGLVRGKSLNVLKSDASSALPQPNLTDTELLRARGLVGIGIVGCLYAPEVISFLTLGQDWWKRVGQVYPGQPYMESTNALFGVFATQASMLAHRAGKVGLATFEWIVPAFLAVCIALTILPCAAGFYWLGDRISFFDFYAV